MPLARILVEPEHELLLRVLRSDADFGRDFPSGHRAWNNLVRCALRHQIPSLVASRVLHVPRETVPPQLIDRCRQITRKIGMRNMLMLAKAERIGSMFRQAGLTGVLLKGASLAETAYSGTWLRLFRDLDILIPRERLDAAVELLHALKFQSALQPVRDRHYRQKHFHIILCDAQGTIIELHWDLVRPDSPYSLPGEGVLARSIQPTRPGHLRDESLEDQLLHAASQSLSEGFSRLLRVCDVAVILEKAADELDWDGIVRRARAGRLGPALHLLLDLSARLLGRACPRGIAAVCPSRRVISGLAHHQPERMVLTRFTGKNVGYTHLLQFWLLPGARTTVLNHFLFGHPRDRTLPVVPGTAGPSIGARLVLFMKRVAVVAKLAAVQLCVSIVGPARRTRPVSADQAEHRR